MANDMPRLTEDQQRTLRLDSTEQFAGAVGHDFANHLAAILGHLTLAQLTETLSPEAAKHLAEVERAAWNARELTQQLIAFGKVGKPEKQPLALPDVVRESIFFALQTARNAPVVSTEFIAPNDLWSVAADAGQLSQVINNLALNAFQAMGEQGGSLRIIARNRAKGSESEAVFAHHDAVHLSFVDTGPGMSPQALARIFDPCTSTRKKGIGLGLATAYSVINKHEGHIRAESTLGVGTTIHIYLQANSTAARSPVQPAVG
jgi:signal transduction histidine kinase